MLANELIPSGTVKLAEHDIDAIGKMETSQVLHQQCSLVGAICQENHSAIIHPRGNRASTVAPNNGKIYFRNI